LCRLWKERVLAYLASSCGRPSAHTLSPGLMSHSCHAMMRRV
ncbi:unnamed protein product, partial [Ectocarpus sp. 8 AP-2014]